MPAAHVKHAAALVAPTTAFAVPTGHEIHVGSPCESPYVPAGHAAHVATPSPPVSHDEQTEAPEPLNVPCPQKTHAATLVEPLFGFALPAGQFSHTAAPADEYEPAAQATHASIDAEYALRFAVPAGHGRQVD